MNGIDTVLRSLDQALYAAVQSAHTTWSSDSISERFRGLYLSKAEIEQWIRRPPGAPATDVTQGWKIPFDSCPPLKRLKEAFSLTTLELAVILIALAPEVDLKYERLYAYLQDDLSRKRPTVDLVLSLLCSSAEEKLRHRAMFSAESRLIRNRILNLTADPNQTQPPLLSHYICLDEVILKAVLGEPGFDCRLANCCRHESPLALGENVPLAAVIRNPVANLVQRAAGGLVLHLRGATRSEALAAARVAAESGGQTLLIADLISHADPAVIDDLVRLVIMQALLWDALPLLEIGDYAPIASVAGAMRDCRAPAVVASSDKMAPLHITGVKTVAVRFSPLCAAARKSCWMSALKKRDVDIDASIAEQLANRFRLSPDQIEVAAEDSCAAVQWRLAVDPDEAVVQPSPEELYAAARAQSGIELAALARKLRPSYRWEDLVLPPETVEQLREICQRINCREKVIGTWGFDRKFSLGKGTSALFAGPSGTGKTMAAEVIANEVQLDLFTIDLAGVVSKYIGETEKNLDRIFAAAEGSNAILFFDEADALFGKRSEVRDSHDRYANLEISYLLQKMDGYEGVTILASNLRQHMDDSFIRRLAFTVLFSFPDETYRSRIWRSIWPQETPVANNIDFDSLAYRYKLSGGNIKNIVLASAFLAAEDGGVVHLDHLLHAVEREYQKMGKTIETRAIPDRAVIS
jgi:hypothetical protein